MLNQGISPEYKKKTVVESTNLSCLVLTESNIRRSSWHLTTNFHAIPLVRKTMSMSSEVILAIFSRRSNLHFSTASQVEWPRESYWLIHDGISLFDGQTLVPTKPSKIHPGYTAGKGMKKCHILRWRSSRDCFVRGITLFGSSTGLVHSRDIFPIPTGGNRIKCPSTVSPRIHP